MLYHFDLPSNAIRAIYPDAVNEQWNAEGGAFALGAERIEEDFRARLEKGEEPSLREYQAAARLHEWAAAAYRVAASRTMGHGKSDRYEQQARNHVRQAARLYREALRRFDWAEPNEHVRELIAKVYGGD